MANLAAKLLVRNTCTCNVVHEMLVKDALKCTCQMVHAVLVGHVP